MFDLDSSAQVFIADHRVGSSGLLSTVMSLEALAEAVTLVCGWGAIDEASAVLVGKPLFVPDGEKRQASVEVHGEGDAATATLSSVSGVHQEKVEHLSAVLRPRVAGGGAPARRDVPSIEGRSGAASPEIYKLYFHGPSFQVVDSAYVVEAVVVAPMAQELAPIGEPTGQSHTSPRLVELCLQAAGLYEVAASGRMRIPSSIQRIVWHSPDRTEKKDGLVAVVERVPDSDREPAYDAAVIDLDGSVGLSVFGYRATDFSQPVDQVALLDVRSALGPLR